MDIEQSRYSRSRPHAEGRADPGKEYLLNATVGKRCAHVKNQRNTPPQVGRKGAINDDVANRTPVRAKRRLVEIRKHSREEMKKAS